MKDPLTDCLSLASRRLARVVSQIYDHALAPTGLKITQFTVLTAVSKAQPHGLPLQAIAEAIDMDQSSLTRALAPFFRDKLIAYADQTDKRRRTPVLTEKGEALLSKATQAWSQAQDQLEEQIGTELLGEGRKALADMRHRIKHAEQGSK